MKNIVPIVLFALILFFLRRKKSAGFIWPHDGVITSPYGMRMHPITGEQKMHEGIDIDGETGDIVRSANDGTVIYAGYDALAGNYVKIEHAHGYISKYLHLSKIWVSIGEVVTAGQTIGEMGSTGSATGSHLHFGLNDGSGWIDPLGYFPDRF